MQREPKVGDKVMLKITPQWNPNHRGIIVRVMPEINSGYIIIHSLVPSGYKCAYPIEYAAGEQRAWKFLDKESKWNMFVDFCLITLGNISSVFSRIVRRGKKD